MPVAGLKPPLAAKPPLPLKPKAPLSFQQRKRAAQAASAKRPLLPLKKLPLQLKPKKKLVDAADATGETPSTSAKSTGPPENAEVVKTTMRKNKGIGIDFAYPYEKWGWTIRNIRPVPGQAGLRVGDVLVGVNGVTLLHKAEADQKKDFATQLKTLPPRHAVVDVTVLRPKIRLLPRLPILPPLKPLGVRGPAGLRVEGREQSHAEEPIAPVFVKEAGAGHARKRHREWKLVLNDVERRSFMGHLQNPFTPAETSHWWKMLRHVDVKWYCPMKKVQNYTYKTAWLVDGGCSCKYHYGFGVHALPTPFPPVMQEIMQVVMPYFGITKQEDWPNCCNLNLYQNGWDKVGWHADDEPLFESTWKDTLICSLSLQGSRRFQCRIGTAEDEGPVTASVLLQNGDLCSMEGLFQGYYVHRVPSEGNAGITPRINLTWRWIREHRQKDECPLAKPKVPVPGPESLRRRAPRRRSPRRSPSPVRWKRGSSYRTTARRSRSRGKRSRSWERKKGPRKERKRSRSWEPRKRSEKKTKKNKKKKRKDESPSSSPSPAVPVKAARSKKEKKKKKKKEKKAKSPSPSSSPGPFLPGPSPSPTLLPTAKSKKKKKRRRKQSPSPTVDKKKKKKRRRQREFSGSS